MENWFIADAGTLVTYFGQGFAPKRPDVENVPKRTVFDALAKATKNCKSKLPYDKGAHSFEILARLDPAPVTAASPWARRFIGALQASP